MATEMSSSQRKLVHEQRPVMSADLFVAAMKGNADVLIQRLGLLEEQKEVKETTEASHSAPQQIKTENQTVQSELQSATHFGDTVLHLLVTKRHNELTMMVFKRDRSLLKAQNKMLETPLHCAAKVGNREVIKNLIQIDPAVVKDVLQETNEKGDTALHVAVKYDFEDVSIKLMEVDPKVAYRVNNELLPPLYIAIEDERDSIAKKMLQVDPILACTQFTDGMFPVHFAARKGNWMIVQHFMEKYPDFAELVDPRGRNLFHIAAEEDNHSFFLCRTSSEEDMQVRMNDATDYEGNTPLHIAAMKGHMSTMRFIWKNRMNRVAETVQNKRGLTPYEVSKIQLRENTNEDPRTMFARISDHEMTYGEKFSKEWFTNVMKPSSFGNRWERTQVIGLGSVLITTVTFAAAFTIPGGYNQDNGTPILARRYTFWAFILANALAFIQGFLSLFALLINALPDLTIDTFEFATICFLYVACSMVVAFGLGLYVTLAPVCLPIAIILLVISLFIGSPALFLGRYLIISTNFPFNANPIVAIYGLSIMFIFFLAFLSQ